MFKTLVTLFAAAMAVSWFLPWFSGPLAEGSTPSVMGPDLYKLVTSDGFKMSDIPTEVLLFVASFAFAALFGLLALMGLASRLGALITGALPVAAVAVSLMRGASYAADLGLPIDFLEVSGNDLRATVKLVSEFLAVGAWLYLAGAAGLLLTGLLVPQGRD
ncbi:MAG: hypothetical protein KDK10_06975 [Maritimibacter sp.]|nr:hypothetical protein [Maritimibacter sp.]